MRLTIVGATGGIGSQLLVQAVAAGTALELGLWDVRLLIERDGDPTSPSLSPRRTP